MFRSGPPDDGDLSRRLFAYLLCLQTMAEMREQLLGKEKEHEVALHTLRDQVTRSRTQTNAHARTLRDQETRIGPVFSFLLVSYLCFTKVFKKQQSMLCSPPFLPSFLPPFLPSILLPLCFPLAGVWCYCRPPVRLQSVRSRWKSSCRRMMLSGPT
jgi:hypothetical protein